MQGMKGRMAVVGGLCVAAGVGVWMGMRATNGTSAPGPAPASAASAPRAPQTVSLYTVATRDMPVEVQATGTLAPLNVVELRPQATAVVRRIAVKEGQTVRAGALLFALDDRTEQANVDKARATLVRDQATLADLERQWRRAQELRAQNFIAQSAADATLTQLEAQKALVAADEAALRAAQTADAQQSLTAPISGRLGAININPGSLVMPSGAALVSIAQLDPISVAFTLTEAQWSTLLNESGGPAALQGLPLQVSLGAVGGRGAAPAEAAKAAQEGKLTFVDNAVDSTSGTIRLKGELANPGQKLWPGQYVNVRLRLRTLKDVPVVPQAALIVRGAERMVYVVDAAGQAQLRKLRVRYGAGEWVAVDGVEPGEKVVLEGKQNLRPGTPVKEAPAKPAGKASGTAGGGAGEGARALGAGASAVGSATPASAGAAR